MLKRPSIVHKALLLLFACLVCANGRALADTWTELHPPLHPAGNFRAAMATDEGRGVVVIFGGLKAGIGQTNETWEWDGTSWELMAPLQSPSPRSEIAMAYNSTEGKILMVGQAYVNSVVVMETWEYDGTTWSQLSTATTPPPRANGQLVFDSNRDVFVFFGGTEVPYPPRYSNPYVYHRDTWEFDGVDWRERLTVDAPNAVTGSMVYDRSRGLTFLFGGYDGTDLLNETWQYDGLNWTELGPEHSPPPRGETTMYFDSYMSKTVLFAGAQPNGGTHFLNDTWIWDGVDWKESVVAAPPPHRKAAMIGFDPVRNKGVLFGGFTGSRTLDDTWEFDLEATATVTPTPTLTPIFTETATPTPSPTSTPTTPIELLPTATPGSDQTTIPTPSPAPFQTISTSPTVLALTPIPPETATPAVVESPSASPPPEVVAPASDGCNRRDYTSHITDLNKQRSLFSSLAREVYTEILRQGAVGKGGSKREDSSAYARSFNGELNRLMLLCNQRMRNLPRSVFTCPTEATCRTSDEERSIRRYRTAVRNLSTMLDSAVRHLKRAPHSSRRKAANFESRRAQIFRASMATIAELSANQMLCAKK